MEHDDRHNHQQDPSALRVIASSSAATSATRRSATATTTAAASNSYLASPRAMATASPARRERRFLFDAARPAAAAAAAGDGHGGSPPSTDSSRRRDRSRAVGYCTTNNDSSNSSNYNNSNNSSSSASAARVLLKARRFLWTFWRRRTAHMPRNSGAVVAVEGSALFCSNSLSWFFRRYPRWVKGFAATAAVVIAGTLWFMAITAMVGPPGQQRGRMSDVGGGRLRDGNKGGKTGGRRSSKGGAGGGYRVHDDHINSYYMKIPAEAAVGPSLAEPWMVREINLAAAEWGWTLESRRRGGGNAAATSTTSAEQSGMVMLGGVAVGRRGGRGGVGVGGGGDARNNNKPVFVKDDWDGRVNGVVTGPLAGGGGRGTSTNAGQGGLAAHDIFWIDTACDDGIWNLSYLVGRVEESAQMPDAARRDLLRQIYDKYDGWVKVGGVDSKTGGKGAESAEFTVSVVFVVSREGSPPEGELIGDMLYVPVPEGYRNIVLKTRAMLCLVRHFDFKYLLKADDDSFVCLARIASMLHELAPEVRGKVYAGVPTACNQPTNPDYWNGRVMKDSHHRWFDSKYVQHTLGGLDCFPAYMQGAFYILAQPLVEHLYRGHEHLECFTNEDVTIGSWLMGVDREMVEMYNLRNSHLWDCLCARTQITAKTRRKQMFFHNCKGMSQLKLCGTRLLRPGIGC